MVRPCAAPGNYNQYEYGFRVPLIVVSPYARAGYVSHVRHDFGSILNFIEEKFGLPSLGFADARADDLADCFDFSQPVKPFEPVTSNVEPAYFQYQEMPPIDVKTDPDED